MFIYSDLCLNQGFEAPALRRKAPRRSVVNSAHSLLQYVYSTSSLPTLRTCHLNWWETLLNCKVYTRDDGFGCQEGRGNARDKLQICLYLPQFSNTTLV
jgi:hypothetical protein